MRISDWSSDVCSSDLENELGEARLAAKGRRAGFAAPDVNADILKNIEEYGQDEIDDLEDLIATGATTAETVEQLALAVETLTGLATMALGVLRSGLDAKKSEERRVGKESVSTCRSR